jgi:hypothetical protein
LAQEQVGVAERICERLWVRKLPVAAPLSATA